MEHSHSFDDKCKGGPANATPPDAPIYDYIRLNMGFYNLQAGDYYHEYRQQVKNLEAQIVATGVSPHKELDRIISFMAKSGWDFYEIAGQLRARYGNLTKKKVVRWFRRLEGKPEKLGLLGRFSHNFDFCHFILTNSAGAVPGLSTGPRRRNEADNVAGDKDNMDTGNTASASASTPLNDQQHTKVKHQLPESF